jgi:hypothetical protein
MAVIGLRKEGGGNTDSMAIVSQRYPDQGPHFISAYKVSEQSAKKILGTKNVQVVGSYTPAQLQRI